MTGTGALRSLWQSAILPAGCFGLLGLFGWHTLAGENGLLALGQYQAEKELLQVRAEEVAAERARLEHRVELLGERAEPDYAEELVRRRLGLVREDEIIVRLGE